MSIRPVDITANYKTSLEINKLNAYDQEKASLFRSQFQQKLDQDIKKQKESVLKLEKTDKQNVDKDGRNKKEDKKEDKKDKKNTKKTSETKKNSLTMFDQSV